MQAQDFSYDPLKLFGTSRFGATTAEIDDEVSRWLETHHPIEIFDKRMPYPSNFYLDLGEKRYGTLREVLNSLRSEFSYSIVMQRYADLLATNQPVSVEPITFFINCLKDKIILQKGQDQIRNALDTDEMIEILSNCKQPGINQVMSNYIDSLQAEFIEFMMKRARYSTSRYEAKLVLQYHFQHLIIPFLEELTNLNRNPKGHDFIEFNLTLVRLGKKRPVYPVLVEFIYGDGPNYEKNYNEKRQILIDRYKAPAEAARAGIEDILTRVDRDVAARAADRAHTLALGNDVSDALSQPRLNHPGSEERQQFARRSRRNLDDLDLGGGKRTKKRKQKRSTNKKRRVHKKRGRMSKRR